MTFNEQTIHLDFILQAPSWFQEKRQQALDWRSIPSKRLEQIAYQDWFKYQETYGLKDDEDPLTYSLPAALAESETKNQIVHAGNRTIYEAMDPEHGQAGLVVCDLFEGMLEYSDVIEGHLFSLIPQDMDQVSAYNLSHINGGIFIYVPDNLVLDQPIEVTWIQDSRQEQAFNKRLLIVAGDNTSFTLVERSQTQGEEANTATIMTEVLAGANAQINYIAFDTFGQKTSNYIRRYGKTQRDASIHWSIAAMNDGPSVLDAEIQLYGQGSQANLATISVGDGQQHQGINAKIINKAPHTIGNIIQHGVVLEDATVTFNGIGHILKQAKQADSQQESRIMMLSDGARGDANPILLIDEFEVQAGHAASIGRVDEEQLYYLMSRGLKRKQAEYLVIRGFLGQVFADVKDPSLRQDMVACLDYKLRNY